MKKITLFILIVFVGLSYGQNEIDTRFPPEIENSKNNKSDLMDLRKKEIGACMNAENDAHKIYENIKDKNFETKIELDKIISYRNALLIIYEKCNKIYAFRKDANQANELSKEIKLVIRKLQEE